MSPPKTKKVYKKVYQRPTVDNKSRPGIGKLEDLEAGDMVCFMDGAGKLRYITRQVERVVAGHLEMARIETEKTPYLVSVVDVYNAIRFVGEEEVEPEPVVVVKPEPPKKPVEKAPVVEKPARKKGKRVRAEPGFNILDLIPAPGDGKPKVS